MSADCYKCTLLGTGVTTINYGRYRKVKAK